MFINKHFICLLLLLIMTMHFTILIFNNLSANCGKRGGDSSEDSGGSEGEGEGEAMQQQNGNGKGGGKGKGKGRGKGKFH